VRVTEVAEIEKAALQLPLGQRVSLAQTLLDSLPRVSEDVSEEAELAEAERREREIEIAEAGSGRWLLTLRKRAPKAALTTLFEHIFCTGPYTPTDCLGDTRG
jgi:hypothetical protein